MKFKVGDRVKISETSRYYGESIANPAEEVGTIDRIQEYFLGIHVEWGPEVSNSYNPSDLEFVSKEVDLLLPELIALTNGLAMGAIYERY